MLKSRSLFSHYSDIELFELTRNDNHHAFEELYCRYWPILLDAAYKRLQTRQKAEDIVQDLLVSIYNRRHTIELTTSFAAYVHQALKFSILNEIRATLVRETYSKSLFSNDSNKTDFANTIELKALDSQIHQSLNVLPRKCKQVFLLSRQENTPYKEISKCLNISLSTVEKHMVKALKIMRNNLQEYRYS